MFSFICPEKSTLLVAFDKENSNNKILLLYMIVFVNLLTELYPLWHQKTAGWQDGNELVSQFTRYVYSNIVNVIIIDKKHINVIHLH